jgi:hypothetical protein
VITTHVSFSCSGSGKVKILLSVWTPHNHNTMNVTRLRSYIISIFFHIAKPEVKSYVYMIFFQNMYFTPRRNDVSNRHELIHNIWIGNKNEI